MPLIWRKLHHQSYPARARGVMQRTRPNAKPKARRAHRHPRTLHNTLGLSKPRRQRGQSVSRSRNRLRGTWTQHTWLPRPRPHPRAHSRMLWQELPPPQHPKPPTPTWQKGKHHFRQQDLHPSPAPRLWALRTTLQLRFQGNAVLLPPRSKLGVHPHTRCPCRRLLPLPFQQPSPFAYACHPRGSKHMLTCRQSKKC